MKRRKRKPKKDKHWSAPREGYGRCGIDCHLCAYGAEHKKTYYWQKVGEHGKRKQKRVERVSA